MVKIQNIFFRRNKRLYDAPKRRYRGRVDISRKPKGNSINMKFNLKKYKWRIILLIIILIIGGFFSILDKVIRPIVMNYAVSEMRQIIRDEVHKKVAEYTDDGYDYDEFIEIVRDNNGRINLVKADTISLNKLACNVSIGAQNEIKTVGELGIKIPIGYILKNNIFANTGPSVNIRMQPVGNVETTYKSEFESSGINQTVHRIYMEVTTEVKIIIPTDSESVVVKTIIPIAETVIVGDVPKSAINLNLDKAAFDYKIDPQQNKR